MTLRKHPSDGSLSRPSLPRPQCSRCFYFRALQEADPLMAERGECTRYPPTNCPHCFVLDEDRPIVRQADSCGEFVSREEAIERFDPTTQRLMRGRR